MSRRKSQFGAYMSDMRSGYYPPMSYDEWLYNIHGVAEDSNMEIDVTVYVNNNEGEIEEHKRTYTVCACSDDMNDVFDYAKEKAMDEFSDYDDLEIESFRWLE